MTMSPLQLFAENERRRGRKGKRAADKARGECTENCSRKLLALLLRREDQKSVVRSQTHRPPCALEHALTRPALKRVRLAPQRVRAERPERALDTLRGRGLARDGAARGGGTRERAGLAAEEEPARGEEQRRGDVACR
jgi:hypothetical protein